MAKSKKTKAERRNECLAADQQAWKSFEPKLAALQTREDALALVAAAPPESAPGRRYYSNLGFFLDQFTVPLGANGSERLLYARFIERLDAAGTLKPGAAGSILASLRSTG